MPSYDQKTTEVNFNYIIKQFNARVMTFYKDTRYNRGETQYLAAGNRPPDPDVRIVPQSNQGVNL